MILEPLEIQNYILDALDEPDNVIVGPVIDTLDELDVRCRT